MTRRLRLPAALVLWSLVVALVGSFVGAGETAGQGLHHAGLVIAFGDGHTERRCIEFSGDEISGAELLQRSGLPVVFSGYGGLGSGVCRIGDTGCSDPGDCFCQCRGGDCAYWSYFRLEDGEWRFQNVGPSTRRLHDGDIDGWVWGNGRTPPPATTSGDVCAPLEPTRAPPGASPPAPTEAGAGGPAPPAVETVRQAPGSSGNVVAPTAGPAPPSATAGASPDASTPVRTLTVRSGLDGRDGGEAPGNGSPASAGSDGHGGAPVGLIAFGVVAAALVAAIGGVLLRRRFGG